MLQLSFTERAARSLNTGATLLTATTELYELYTHPENIQLYIEIVGINDDDAPRIYIDDVTLKTLRYTLSQLDVTALKNCVIWLRADDDTPIQEFAVVSKTRQNDFEVKGCNFNLYPFAEWRSDYSTQGSSALICHEEEVVEAYHKIMNIINNNNK